MPKRRLDKVDGSEAEENGREDHDAQEARPKRTQMRRSYVDDENEENLEIDDSGDARPSQRARGKQANTKRPHDDDEDEENMEIDGSGDARPSHRARGKQPREMVPFKKRRPGPASGGGDSEVDLSQIRDFNLSESKMAEVGIIEKVALRNFMCHSRLDVNLGPHVNFIVGRNGSGKSAIVTGLVVGLGGKAIVTSRSHSVKSFIKTGKVNAEVEVHLRNQGSQAYKHDLYGDTIIILRKLSSDGTSKYTLKSKDSKVVSEKREELTHILDYFNVQVDNPVAILNQDTSRNFLNSKSPHDRYKFFCKATLLEQLMLDHESAQKHITETELIMSEKKKAMMTHREEVLEWEQKFKALDTVEELKLSVRRLKNEMAWAIVCEKERELEPLVKRLEKECGRRPVFQQKVEDSKTKVAELDTKLAQIQEKIVVVNEEIKQMTPEVTELKKKSNQEKELMRTEVNKMKGIEKDMQNARHDRDQYLERIADMRRSANRDYEAARQKRQADIEALAQKLKTHEARRNTLSHELDTFRGCLSNYKEETASLANEEQSIRGSHTQLQQQVRNLHSARGDRLKRYGAYIPAVLQKIQEYSRRGLFQRPPIGPLGETFRLKDQRWALAVEICLKSLLYSFCVDNHKDMKTLETIFASCIQDGRRPAIIIRKFKESMHDVSRKRVRSDSHPCMLDVLQFEDPNAANVLIDQRNIENVILIADKVQARTIMQCHLPENCRECFTASGDQILVKPTFRYYSSDQERARVLTVNVEEQIMHCQAEINRLEVRLREIAQRRDVLQAEIRKNQGEERQVQSQLKKVGEVITKVQCDMRELQSVEEPAPVDVTTLEEEVENLNQQLEQMAGLLEKAKEALAAQEQKFKEAETAYKNFNRDCRQKLDVVEPLREEQERLTNEANNAQGNVKHYEARLQEFDKQLQAQEKNLDKYRQELAVNVEKARELEPERIKTRRIASNIDGEISQIMKRIRIEEKNRGDAREITRKYKEVKEKYDKIEEAFKQNEVFLAKLRRVTKGRDRHYKNFRAGVALRTNYCFLMYLNNRNYVGNMVFNHSAGTLDLKISTQDKSSSSVSDLKGLSGGERSFATVCFILALWEAMESPFRCLDEYDVFMDMVNRRISMDMMMSVADNQTMRQFIFLTPQDMTRVQTKNKYRIFRMPDPDRASIQARQLEEDEDS